MNKPRLALWDLDGTLADDRARVPYALSRNWIQYFLPENVAADKVFQEGFERVWDMWNEGWDIQYLTGRRDTLYNVSSVWLLEKEFPENEKILMRKFTETLPLANFKVEIMRKIIASDMYSEVVLFDDDPEVIRFVHEKLGIEHAVHCTWHIKEKALVKAAKG